MAKSARTALARMAKRRRALEAARGAFRPNRSQRISPDPMMAALRHEIGRLSEEVRGLARLVLTDSLTGLGNRRSWDEQLSRELALSRRSREPLSVAVLDLDDFKAFNDSHGHRAGDRLLVGVAAAWRSELRDVDALCHWSGGEFVALLHNCPRDRADAVIARLAAATPQGRSCAAGAACWDGWETEHELLGRAEQALYEAKGLVESNGNGRPVGITEPAGGDGTGLQPDGGAWARRERRTPAD
jgi:diguanylate cyclase (GGDEF)-like protein